MTYEEAVVKIANAIWEKKGYVNRVKESHVRVILEAIRMLEEENELE